MRAREQWGPRGRKEPRTLPLRSSALLVLASSLGRVSSAGDRTWAGLGHPGDFPLTSWHRTPGLARHVAPRIKTPFPIFPTDCDWAYGHKQKLCVRVHACVCECASKCMCKGQGVLLPHILLAGMQM